MLVNQSNGESIKSFKKSFCDDLPLCEDNVRSRQQCKSQPDEELDDVCQGLHENTH